MEINPVFNDLQKPETFINHVENLKMPAVEAQLVQLNPFPVDVFPKPIQEIITSTNTCLNFPIDFISSSILFAISAAIGNTHAIEVKKGWQEYAILYLVIVGRPGTNKSHPISFALEPIESRDNKTYLTYLMEIEEYNQNMGQSLKTKASQNNNELPKPKWKQRIVSDFTPEALADVHKYNPQGIGVYVDELATWFKNFNRYNKGSEEQFWLSAWSGKQIRINRKTSEPTLIQHPFIPVIGTIQPSILQELAENRTENGFFDRLLFVVPDELKKEYWSEAELNPEIKEHWQNILSIEIMNRNFAHSSSISNFDKEF